ncbi:DUF3696 domain-containing protein [Treponema ruminis]|uniref:Putative ATPase n=1 Tax=Treponema ruminis TaxID=744515 RepID=A0A7W8GA16_9SPIR|nr:DUF3696 domain-containing protein [Treponema ruminis]MBB5226575.1 putative ATPase [Treponema ruminis]QSI02195.1 DUF3696 domain-containing protein [Treponema ruminis]
MIKKLGIKNFKSLRNVSLRTSNLNLLIGLNSMGKSSIIQSLLMLRQSYSNFSLLNKLYINDYLISLGNSNDVFFQNAGEQELLSFSLVEEHDSIKADYKYSLTPVDALEADNIQLSKDNVLNKLSLFTEHFHYLDANHISPSKTYKYLGSEKSRLNILGNSGENAPYYLAKFGAKELKNKSLHHPNAKSYSLANELDAWMGEISPGTRIISKELADVDLVKMGIQFESTVSENENIRHEMSNEFSPINVGFGITYVLPLILTILISEPGDLVLIENPESHLHPRGQSELGKLVALAAESGVQIFCETHSDHVINGTRVAVKNKIIEENKVKLFYFEKEQNSSLETKIISISVDSNGELDKYPQGLLDEWGNLMAQLF